MHRANDTFHGLWLMGLLHFPKKGYFENVFRCKMSREVQIWSQNLKKKNGPKSHKIDFLFLSWRHKLVFAIFFLWRLQWSTDLWRHQQLRKPKLFLLFSPEKDIFGEKEKTPLNYFFLLFNLIYKSHRVRQTHYDNCSHCSCCNVMWTILWMHVWTLKI